MSHPGTSEHDPTNQVTELDLRGLLCPQPVLRTAASAALLPPGSVLVAYCSDPGVEQDMPIWCRMHGHRLEAIDVRNHEYHVRIRLGPHEAGSPLAGPPPLNRSR